MGRARSTRALSAPGAPWEGRDSSDGRRRRRGGDADRQLLPRVFLALLVFGTVAALVAGVWATPIMRLLTSEIYIGSEGAPGADSALVLLALPMFLNSLIENLSKRVDGTLRWIGALITDLQRANTLTKVMEREGIFPE